MSCHSLDGVSESPGKRHALPTMAIGSKLDILAKNCCIFIKTRMWYEQGDDKLMCLECVEW